MGDYADRLRRVFDDIVEQAPEPPDWEKVVDYQPGSSSRSMSGWLVAAGVAISIPVLIVAISTIGPSTSSVATFTPRTVESATPAAATPLDGSPGLFGRELPWTLVFDNGLDRIKAIDSNKMIPYESVVEGSKGGDPPFRIHHVDGHLIVGWGKVFAHDLQSLESRSLGEATVFLPAHEDDRVWMIQYDGSIGANPPEVWQVDVEGNLLTDKVTIETDGIPALGVRGGLAIETDRGIEVWEYETRTVVRRLGIDRTARVLDSSETGLIAWCAGACDQIEVDASDSGLVSARHPDGGSSFGAARFSPDGRWLAATSGWDVVLIDLSDGSSEVILTFPDQEVSYITWSPAGHDLFAASYSYGLSSMTVGYYGVLGGHSAVTELPFGGTLDFVVVPTREVRSLLNPELSSCPVTIPTQSGFLAPEPWPTHFPEDQDGIFWYGTDDLWTVLPLRPSEYGPRKSVWWSANFPGGVVEERPEITVTWRRLDQDAPVVQIDGGTNAHIPSQGHFMIAGFDPSEPGCWQVTATYKGATLSYVYDNRGS